MSVTLVSQPHVRARAVGNVPCARAAVGGGRLSRSAPRGRALAAAVAIALLPGLAACSTLQDMGNALLPSDKPTASVVATHLRDLSLEAVTLTLDVKVDNPYAAALPLSALDYRISSGDTLVLSGQATPAAPLPAKSSTVIPVDATVPFAKLLSVLSGVKPGALVPYSAAVDISLDAPVIGPLKLPLQTTGELPIPAVPEVTLTGLHWSEISLSAAKGTLELGLRNTNAFPIDLRTLGFGLTLGGSKVADAAVQPTGSVQPQASTSLKVPLSFAPSSLGLAVLNLLKGESASYALEGTLEVGTPFGPLKAPFQRTGKVPLTH